MVVTTQVCTRCKEEKPLEQFDKRPSRPTGRKCQCKTCQAKDFSERAGICEICKSSTKLVIDHCHTSGNVRGRICSACNSVLGYSRDNTQTLKSAIGYLEKFYGAE